MLIERETPQFISPDLWPPNSPDLNLVDYKTWAVLQERVYKDVTSRKRIEAEIDRSVLCNAAVCHRQAIDEWRKRLRSCISAKGGGHF